MVKVTAWFCSGVLREGAVVKYFLKSFSISNRKSVKILKNQYSWRHCEGGCCGEGNWFCSGVLREGAVVKVTGSAQEC